MTLQTNAAMVGESASPGVRHSRVQQNASGHPNAFTGVRGGPPFTRIPVVGMTAGNQSQPNHQSGLVLGLQVMKGGQIQASGLDHPAGWPRIHAAVATNGCVPVVCESEAQRLAPIMTLQINVMMRWGGRPGIAPKGA